jgi:hypothetical protein
MYADLFDALLDECEQANDPAVVAAVKHMRARLAELQPGNLSYRADGLYARLRTGVDVLLCPTPSMDTAGSDRPVAMVTYRPAKVQEFTPVPVATPTKR